MVDTRPIPAQLIAQLKRDEGIRLTPYADPLHPQISTIGIGRNLTEVGISEAEAENLCVHDIIQRQNQIAELYPWTTNLDTVRYGVLLNMGFMGIEKLEGFKEMLACLKAGDYVGASRQLLNSDYAHELPERAARLATQLVSGVWQ